MPDVIRCDILVIGAGMAGASAAAELAAEASVVLIERESQPGYHTTGRSAALFTETYGPPEIRALTGASGAFLAAPPDGFAEHPLTAPRGAMLIGRADQAHALDAAEAGGRSDGTRIERLDPAAAIRLVPALRADYVAGAILEHDARDLDVAALHAGYLRLLRSRGGQFVSDAGLTALDRQAGLWRAATAVGAIEASVVVNAAGAWADAVAEMAGAKPVGLVPKRRTAILFEPTPPVAASGWPMVIDIDEQFYFKPESGRVLGSPADETPSAPCDAQPEELDVAIAVDRIEAATTMQVRRISHRWAGLRSFVADKVPVVGFDDAVDGFFWLAGQGGYGIQTAPALACVTAALVHGRTLPQDVVDRGVTEAQLSPRRLHCR